MYTGERRGEMYTGERRDVLTDTDVGEAVLEFIVRSGSYGNGLIRVGGQSLQSTAISVTAVSVMPVGVRKGDDTHRHTPMLDQPLIPRQFLGGISTIFIAPPHIPL